MSVITRNDVNVWGDGTTPMIFAHGYGWDQNMWRLVAPAFAHTHRLVLFDHVGSGRSDPRAYNRVKYSSLEGYADDLLEICEELGLENGIFVGHSVSGMIGVLAAIKQPERFSWLVPIGPSPRYIDDEGYRGGFRTGTVVGPHASRASGRGGHRLQRRHHHLFDRRRRTAVESKCRASAPVLARCRSSARSTRHSSPGRRR